MQGRTGIFTITILAILGVFGLQCFFEEGYSSKVKLENGTVVKIVKEDVDE